MEGALVVVEKAAGLFGSTRVVYVETLAHNQFLQYPVERRLFGRRDGRALVEDEGEFNWSSQHLDDEVLRCRNGDGEGQTGRVDLRCVRLAGRR